jgi:hypothetical protein
MSSAQRSHSDPRATRAGVAPIWRRYNNATRFSHGRISWVASLMPRVSIRRGLSITQKGGFPSPKKFVQESSKRINPDAALRNSHALPRGGPYNNTPLLLHSKAWLSASACPRRWRSRWPRCHHRRVRRKRYVSAWMAGYLRFVRCRLVEIERRPELPSLLREVA